MTNVRILTIIHKFVNLFHKLGTRSVSRRTRCRLCYTLTAICCSLALMCVPSFALSESQSVPFYTMSKADYGGTTSVVGISNNWTSITAVTEGKYASPLFYKLPETLIVGQTYTLSFDYSGDDFMWIFSLYTTNQWDDFSETNRKVYSEGASEQYNGHIDASFVYNGEPWLAFQFVIPPTKVIRLSPLTITRLNPNAGIESRIDEQNSKLFDGEEVSPLPDEGLDNHINDFKSKLDELKSNVNNVDFINRINRGMQAYNLLFDAFIYNGEQKPYTIKWILPLINFSLFLGVVGAILNIVKASDIEKHKEKRESRGRKR